MQAQKRTKRAKLLTSLNVRRNLMAFDDAIALVFKKRFAVWVSRINCLMRAARAIRSRSSKGSPHPLPPPVGVDRDRRQQRG